MKPVTFICVYLLTVTMVPGYSRHKSRGHLLYDSDKRSHIYDVFTSGNTSFLTRFRSLGISASD